MEVDLEELIEDLDHDLLVALLATQHRTGQKGWPFFIFGADLPALPSRLSEARSYAERLFDYREIGALEAKSAADALVLPARRHGAEFSADALKALVSASGGYPYFLQAYGQSAWEVATSRQIDLEDAQLAIVEGNAALDMGFFPSRWDRTTPAERRYLQAMAADAESGSRTAELAQRLDQTIGGLSPARQSLIDKGVIDMPERGHVAFTVPGMAAFIDRQFTE